MPGHIPVCVLRFLHYCYVCDDYAEIAIYAVYIFKAFLACNLFVKDNFNQTYDVNL